MLYDEQYTSIYLFLFSAHQIYAGHIFSLVLMKYTKNVLDLLLVLKIIW